jgi:hypothetical protein
MPPARFVARCSAVQLRTEVEIAAAPERVWAVLRDFARYPEWNPFIKSIDGQVAVGAVLRVVETAPDGSERGYRARLVKLEPESEIRWSEKSFVSGIFDAERFITLSARDAGATRVVNAGDFSGWLVQYKGNALTQTARGLVGMNEALKRRVERGGRR